MPTVSCTRARIRVALPAAWIRLTYPQLAVRSRDLLEKPPSQAGALKAEVEFQCDAAAGDYRRAGELLEEKPNDEQRYALFFVNRGSARARFLAGISRMPRRTWRRRSGSQWAETRGVCRGWR